MRRAGSRTPCSSASRSSTASRSSCISATTCSTAASRAFVEEFEREKPAAQILLTRVPDPQMFGVAELAGGRVVRLVEKPKEPKSDLALVGVYMFGREVFDSVKRIKPSFRNELEITDAIQDLIDRGLDVRPHIVEGWWKDTGKLEDMLEANRLILDTLERRIDGEVDAESRIEGKVVIEAGAVIERSVIRGPVIIGAERAHLRRLRRAVHVDRRSTSRSATPRSSTASCSRARSSPTSANRIEDSLIGRNVQHPPAAGAPVRVPVHARRQLRGRDPVVEILVTGGAGFIGSNFVRWAHAAHRTGTSRRSTS